MRAWLALSVLAFAATASAADVNTEYEDARRFQAWVRAQQYPADCSSTVGVLTRTGSRPDGSEYPGNYFYGLGLGSQMVSLKFNLVRALLQNRVYHFPTSHYVNPLRCPSRKFDCYFEPPTNCTLPPPRGAAARPGSAHRAVESDKLVWCSELPRKKLSRLAGLAAVHSKAWYHGQLSSFLFRPNAELRAYRESLLPRFETNRSLSRPAGGGGSSLHGGGCAAMHIRRTDKHKGRRREDPCPAKPFAHFSGQFKQWAYWESPRPAGQLRVLLGSEDKATFGAIPPLLAPTSVYWVPGSEFVMKSFKNIIDHNQRLTATYATLLEKHGHELVRGAAGLAALDAAGARRDEGMALVVQIVLMGECEALFGSFASNVAILVHDLMHARSVARRERMGTVDACGRSYCGCGASFCMKLERRAGREPRRAMRNMVDAFNGDNRNAI